MIKQTRGALNFLIASYKAVLKHAVLAVALTSAAAVSSANAKTYDLSDDNNYYTLDQNLNFLKEITDDDDGTDTTITKTLNPNYDGQRTISKHTQDLKQF